MDIGIICHIQSGESWWFLSLYSFLRPKQKKLFMYKYIRIIFMYIHIPLMISKCISIVSVGAFAQEIAKNSPAHRSGSPRRCGFKDEAVGS